MQSQLHIYVYLLTKYSVQRIFNKRRLGDFSPRSSSAFDCCLHRIVLIPMPSHEMLRFWHNVSFVEFYWKWYPNLVYFYRIHWESDLLKKCPWTKLILFVSQLDFIIFQSFKDIEAVDWTLRQIKEHLKYNPLFQSKLFAEQLHLKQCHLNIFGAGLIMIQNCFIF